jgi:dynein heavy chain
VNQREDLIATTQFPNGNKKRSMYLLKKGRVVTDKIAQDCVIGDLSGAQLDQLSVVLEEVYMPLLQNNRNVESWPEVVTADVLRHFQKLSGSVYVINGQAKVSSR